MQKIRTIQLKTLSKNRIKPRNTRNFLVVQEIPGVDSPQLAVSNSGIVGYVLTSRSRDIPFGKRFLLTQLFLLTITSFFSLGSNLK